MGLCLPRLPSATLHPHLGVQLLHTRHHCVFIPAAPALPRARRFEPSLPQFVSLEPPPPGCEPDALKLYVGNIPTSYTVDDIRQVFKQYGRVSLPLWPPAAIRWMVVSLVAFLGVHAWAADSGCARCRAMFAQPGGPAVTRNC